jgi:pyocin large subunit-like protein
MPVRGFRNDQQRRLHFAKHGADFGAASDLDYERRAVQFLGGPLAPDAAECTRPGGGLVRYNDITREFGVVLPSGFVGTYFTLKGTVVYCRRYFCENCKK